MPGIERLIDVHAHCVPQSLYDRVAAGDPTLGVTSGRTPDGPIWRFDGGAVSPPVESLLVDIEARLRFMDAAGISVQLLSSFIEVGAHHALGDQAPVYAREFNNALACVVQAGGSRFLGMATLPLAQPDIAADELTRAIAQLGFVGAEVPASYTGQPDLEPLWRRAAELRAILLIHPEAAATSTLPFFLGNFVGNPAETTVAASTLIMSGVVERNPDLRIVLVHGGGFLPYQVGRLNRGFHEYGGSFGARLTTPPAEQIRHLYYDTILHDEDNLAHLVRTVDADHVVVGTDYPFAMGDHDPHRTVNALDLGHDDQRRKIKGDNVIGLIEEITQRAGAAPVGAEGSLRSNAGECRHS
jgi:aminocarboxymuconate-semialdehyde decarboxylase